MIRFLTVAAFLTLAALHAAEAATVAAKTEGTVAVQGDKIKIYFRNNLAWVRSVTLVYYPPGVAQGQVDTKFLFPFQRFSRSLEEGTKVYIATAEQIERLGQGVEIDNLPPAMTIRASDEGELYYLFPK